jgi:hypothetical protein
MNTCSCGQLVDEKSTQCPRCEALQVLGLETAATESEIRSAYRLLVKTWQPDRFKDDQKLKEAAEEKLKEFNSAFEYLTSTSIERGWGQRPMHASRFVAFPEAAPAAETAPAEAATTIAAPAAIPNAIPPTQLWPKIKLYYRRARWFLRIAAVACVLLTGRSIWTFLKTHNPNSGEVVSVDDSVRKSAPAGAPQAVPPGSLKADNRQPAKTRAAAQDAPPPPRHVVTPYVTVGSTREEVLAQEGTPTASSEDKLVYGKSELYLKDGAVVGWRIDPFSSPIRVKLWPEAPVDPGLEFFSYGSTKDSVLAVQGTPTAFSEDKFEYGGSVVYFQNNRVVSWKNDPASIPLRIRPY